MPALMRPNPVRTNLQAGDAASRRFGPQRALRWTQSAS